MNGFQLPWETFATVEVEPVPNVSADLEFAAVVTSLLRNEEQPGDAVLRLFRITSKEADRFRYEARHHVYRAARHMRLNATADELDAQASTWQLLWHLNCLQSPAGRGGPTVLHDTPTLREQAAEVVNSDKSLARCACIVAWLEAIASDALTKSPPSVGLATGEGIARLTAATAGQGGMVTELDPDAPSRQDRGIQEADAKANERIMGRVWQLLRAGRWPDAQQLCRDVGQPWRAASLEGAGAFGPLAVGMAAVEQDHPSDGLPVEYQEEALAGELDSAPGARKALWKWGCCRAAERGDYLQTGTSYEAAVYGAMCGHVRHMLPVCNSWEDAAWALCRSWMELRADQQLAAAAEALPATQVNASLLHSTLQRLGGGRGGTEVARTLQEGMAVGAGRWPLQRLMDALPEDLGALFLEALPAMNDKPAVLRACQDRHHQMQTDLITGNLEELLVERLSNMVALTEEDSIAELAVGTVPAEDDERLRSDEHLSQRFACHLALMLLALGCCSENAPIRLGRAADVANQLVLTWVSRLVSLGHVECAAPYAALMRGPSRRTLYTLVLEGTLGRSADHRLELFRGSAGWLSHMQERQLKAEAAETGQPEADMDVEEQEGKEPAQQPLATWFANGLESDVRPNEVQLILQLLADQCRGRHALSTAQRFALCSWLFMPFVSARLEEQQMADIVGDAPQPPPWQPVYVDALYYTTMLCQDLACSWQAPGADEAGSGPSPHQLLQGLLPDGFLEYAELSCRQVLAADPEDGTAAAAAALSHHLQLLSAAFQLDQTVTERLQEASATVSSTASAALLADSRQMLERVAEDVVTMVQDAPGVRAESALCSMVHMGRSSNEEGYLHQQLQLYNGAPHISCIFTVGPPGEAPLATTVTGRTMQAAVSGLEAAVGHLQQRYPGLEVAMSPTDTEDERVPALLQLGLTAPQGELHAALTMLHDAASWLLQSELGGSQVALRITRLDSVPLALGVQLAQRLALCRLALRLPQVLAMMRQVGGIPSHGGAAMVDMLVGGGSRALREVTSARQVRSILDADVDFMLQALEVA